MATREDVRSIALGLPEATEDPVIAGGYARGELRPFRVSLLRGRD